MADRDAYVEQLKARIDEWNAKLDELERQARDAKGEANARYKHHLEELSKKRDEARAKLDEIRASTGNAWKDLKEGAEKAVGALKQGIEKAASQFK